jgi:hypothetical protein
MTNPESGRIEIRNLAENFNASQPVRVVFSPAALVTPHAALDARKKPTALAKLVDNNAPP